MRLSVDKQVFGHNCIGEEMKDYKVTVTAKITGCCYIKAKDEDHAKDIADFKTVDDFDWSEPEGLDYESIEEE